MAGRRSPGRARHHGGADGQGATAPWSGARPRRLLEPASVATGNSSAAADWRRQRRRDSASQPRRSKVPSSRTATDKAGAEAAESWAAKRSKGELSLSASPRLNHKGARFNRALPRPSGRNHRPASVTMAGCDVTCKSLSPVCNGDGCIAKPPMVRIRIRGSVGVRGHAEGGRPFRVRPQQATATDRPRTAGVRHASSAPG
jgi:hypothetical protein